MAVTFNQDCVLKTINYTGQFLDSLKFILTNLQNDPNITDTAVAAYLLATGNIESSYSLARWEADYVCKSKGIAMYPPCQAALDYYNSTANGKLDYRTLGVDPNGIPYYGRGLIQITGKSNYKLYGSLISVDLVSHPELALEYINSYKIASFYIKNRTASFILKGDLTGARKSVNNGTANISAVNQSFKQWYDAFTNCGAQASAGGSLAESVQTSSGTNNPSPSATQPTSEQLDKALIAQFQAISNGIVTNNQAARQSFKPKTTGETETSPSTGFGVTLNRT